ncbi:MAG: CDP-alcohol phosphatidyltransferase [Gammaproteobacteria bacterium]|jgi:hypothetical protein|nr:CDP-alcohol phosphatidyltransferase [Gammaproteobacteria bacterium]
MKISALMLQDSPVRLWGLSSRERLRRQVREMGGIEWLEDASGLPASGMLLLLDGNYLFETRTLKKLIDRPGSILHCESDGRPAAAYVSAEQASDAARYFERKADGRSEVPAPFERLEIADLEIFDQKLRYARPPLLEHITPERQSSLEDLLYGNSYRGITDLVTKFLFPRPSRSVVGLCIRLKLSPNTVTAISFLLVVVTCSAFENQLYLWGLLAGWAMSFLDTVDGKLARVTIQSSRFGDLFDHGIDLFHPPFWYVYWGIFLIGFQPVMGLDVQHLSWIVVIAYVAGRAIEGVFPFLGGPSVWTWKPFDAWFRLIVSRRNPCLIILTVSALMGRPDWGFIGVAGWLVFSALILFIRLLQGFAMRITQGPLNSWLSEDDVATGPNARSFRVFAGTRGAYGG